MSTAEVTQESFSLRPNYKKKFRASQVREVIRKVLVEKLEGGEYNADSVSSLTKEVADLIRDRLKQQDYDRYKLIVNVFICEQKGDGVKMVCFSASSPSFSVLVLCTPLFIFSHFYNHHRLIPHRDAAVSGTKTQTATRRIST